MLFGADYYPEQWDRATQQDDLKKMAQLHVNTVTLGVFSWDKLEPSDGKFCLDWLEEQIERLWERGVSTVLATATAGMPFWLMNEHPETMRVNQHGLRMKPGMRANFCPNSPEYRFYANRITEQLAKRFGRHPGVRMWHVNNEYEHYCYCPNCQAEFRKWLKKKYKTVDRLNDAWGTHFWSHTYADFDQILVPTYLSEIKEKELAGRDIACFQGMDTDYHRFMSDSIARRIHEEAETIRSYSDIPITNNYTGLFKPFDYVRLSRELDVISWDNYPTREISPAQTAMTHDIMRSLKNGQGYYVMEQTPNHILWRDYCPTKRPGQVSSLCWQGAAHGARGNMFFQWRQSVTAVEKFHGAMVPSTGRLDTRIGRELEQLGESLERLNGEIRDAEVRARAAVYWSWEDWWMLECSAVYSNAITYPKEVLRYYQGLFELGVDVDMIFSTERLKDYDLILVPFHYAISGNEAKDMERYVAEGGVLLTTTMSGIVEPDDHLVPGGAPGHLRDVMGLWVEETDGLAVGDKKHIFFCGEETIWSTEMVCDVIRCTKAVPLAVYIDDYYAGTPAITENRFGKGRAYFVGVCPEAGAVRVLMMRCLDAAGVKYMDTVAEGVEIRTCWRGETAVRFVINHTDEQKNLTIPFRGIELLTRRSISENITLNGREVMIIKEM